jgi:hypothetical protein
MLFLHVPGENIVPCKCLFTWNTFDGFRTQTALWPTREYPVRAFCMAFHGPLVFEHQLAELFLRRRTANARLLVFALQMLAIEHISHLPGQASKW